MVSLINWWCSLLIIGAPGWHMVLLSLMVGTADLSMITLIGTSVMPLTGQPRVAVVPLIYSQWCFLVPRVDFLISRNPPLIC